jgi:hypothetical protein
MSTVSRVETYIDADADVIHVASRGCDVPMTFSEARAVRDELTALLATHDRGEPTVDFEAREWVDTGSGPGWFGGGDAR